MPRKFSRRYCFRLVVDYDGHVPITTFTLYDSVTSEVIQQREYVGVYHSVPQDLVESCNQMNRIH